MKLILFLLPFILSNNLFCQINPFDIEKLGVQLEFKKATIDEQDIINMDHEMFNDILKEGYLSIDYLNFQFFDFDLDGDQDLKYYGFVGAEPLGTIIFRNNNGKYEELITFLGSIYDIVYNKDSNQLIFTNTVPPCCLSAEETFRYNTLNLTNNEHKKENFISLADPTFPKNFLQSFKIKIINKTYSLRKSPNIDRRKPDESNPLGGNLTAVYSSGTTGMAYAIKTDETGRDWFFVILDQKAYPKESIINYVPTEFNFFGWVSSNYLDISLNEWTSEYCDSISGNISIESIKEFLKSIKKEANKENWSEEEWEYIFPLNYDRFDELFQELISKRKGVNQISSINLNEKIESNFSPKYDTYLKKITLKKVGCCDFELNLYEFTKVLNLEFEPEHNTIVYFNIRSGKFFLKKLFFAG